MAGYSWRNISVIALFLLAAAWQYFSGSVGNSNPASQPANSSVTNSSAANSAKTLAQLRAAANDPDAKFWTTLQGTVIRNLKDDQEGDRHQKFLVQVAKDLTLLVSHNIDVASRVPVREGDTVKIQGEYVWNNRGGVIHWTHRDPNGRQAVGWIEINGKHYE